MDTPKSSVNSYYGPRAVSSTLWHVTQPAFKQRGFAEQRIITDWPLIVGKLIAQYSTPQKLSFPRESRNNGTLYIDVYDSAFATEISYLGPVMKERIATYFGYPAVAHFKLLQKPYPYTEEESSTPPPAKLSEAQEAQLATLLASTGDEALREALESLGRAVLGAKK